MKEGDIRYALECVFVPMAWGMVIMWISMAVQAALHRKAKPEKTETNSEK